MSTGLCSRELQVRYVRTGSRDVEWLSRLAPKLTPDEQTRAGRFLFAKDRLAFAVGRALVRQTLTQHAAEPSGGWQFVCNPHGKPELRPGPATPPVHFNISHCAGMVAAAFAWEREIGVDVECVDRGGATAEIARSYFAPEEVRVLESLPEQ